MMQTKLNTIYRKMITIIDSKYEWKINVEQESIGGVYHLVPVYFYVFTFYWAIIYIQ